MNSLNRTRGFTLVELLVVVAILGVLAVGLIAAINPVDKINSAGDARVLSDIGVLARASESYALQNNGTYPDSIPDLVSSQLKYTISAPSGYSPYVYTGSPSGCSNTGPTFCASVVATSQLKSSKYSAIPFERYESITGKTCQVATAATACP